jgi:alpha-amylase/alpha-mannosidase (GH57 family)
VNVVLWWHFHQPDYREPGGQTAHFPWVRMHAFRAYTDLIALAIDEDLRGMTINMVPSLADQLEDLASGVVEDRHHRLARHISIGDDALAEEAFFAHAVPTPVPHRPLPRFQELQTRARARAPVRVHDAIDACVLFNLAWAGFTAAHDPLVTELLEKGRDYSREDITRLLALTREMAGNVLPRLRRARELGICHVTTTPYAHPILPLLVDTQVAKEATHDKGAPPPFSALDDAHLHVARAIERHEALFGEKPRSMWPAEGALSEGALDVIAAHGIEVLASDEELLRKSLEANDRDAHLSAWKHARTGLGLLFRDRSLSDDWGFVYRDLPAENAARSFVDGCLSRADRGSLVPVILDGENPFERFQHAGHDHLIAFARAARQKLTFLSPEEACAHRPKTLSRLATGSWIHASLDIWAGDDEDRRGWDVLARVRRAIDLDLLDSEARMRAERHLLAAEGSDWFWWFGPEFRIPDKPGFDALFRRHLEEAVSAAGLAKELLPRLDEPIARSSALAHRAVPPIGVVVDETPSGAISLWRDARGVANGADQGSMHRGAPLVEEFAVLLSPRAAFVRARFRRDVTGALLIDVKTDATLASAVPDALEEGRLKLSAAVPFDDDTRELAIRADVRGIEERTPREGALALERPSRRFYEV